MPRLYRRVIRIRAADSPNVRLAMAQIAAGQKPTGEQIVEGVLSWDEYCKRRATWDKIRRCIGLDAQFYTGAELLLFPPEWLNHSENLFRRRGIPTHSGVINYLACDPAEGGDKSSWAVVNRFGLVKLLSLLTPDTTVIPAQTLVLMREYNIKPDNVIFDRGGGGHEHADYLRSRGYPVRTVAFGEAVNLEPKRSRHQYTARVEVYEEKYVYVNRRAQMYGEFSLLLDPGREGDGFAIPPDIRGAEGDPKTELRSQLGPIPKRYQDDRLKLPPKHKKSPDPNSHEETLTELIGHSPDEADAVVMAVHAMLHKSSKTIVGAM